MKKNALRLFSIFIATLMIFGMENLPNSAVAQAPDQHLEKVENIVLDALSTKGTSDYVIQMAEKADLSEAYTIKDWNERGWYVYNTLREVAARTQKPVIEILEKQGVKYQSFFAGNEIAVYGSGLSTLTGITSLEEVDHIRFPRMVTIDPGFFSIQPTNFPQVVINALDWGITDTNADDFWAEFGVQGDGLVVANIDTGVQWDHPALDQSFKCGTNPADPACWADPSNICGASGACDNNGHGTHTMGTMVGDDDPSLAYQVGMAPNAQWIACKGCEDTSCSNSALNACADWLIAPGGNPANRPHIVNNSWGGGGGDAWYLTKVNSWRAAGIFPVFSSGNPGPTCGAISSPSDYQESFAVANHTSAHVIDTDSGQGPSAYGDNPYTKPNLSAPGSSICSSIPGSAWSCSYTGTSMAAPHVAGAVALLWSCNPSLIGNMTATFELLQDTADPAPTGACGAPLDGEGNYTYGYGFLNVLTAGQQVCSAGTLTGNVTNGSNPVEGATVTADNGAGFVVDVLTLADGTYTLNLTKDSYDVSATKFGYTEAIETGVLVTEGSTTNVDFVITPLSSSLVSGFVYDGGVEGLGMHGYPLYSSIRITGSGFDETIYSDPFTGYYEIELVESIPFAFEVQAVPLGYSMLSEVVTPAGASYSKDFTLIVGSSCSAPGYLKSLSATLSEGFESGALPAGWVNYDYIGNGQVWRFDDPGNYGNRTPGGEGGFAVLNSDAYGSGNSQDAGLRTPAIDFTGESSVVIDFDTDFIHYSFGDSGTVRISNDGGVTWAPLWTQTTNFNGHVTLDISAQAANQANVIIEFRYIGTWSFWWQVDNVVISSISCDSAEGGVVAGYVYDANDSSPIVAADVYSDMAATQTFFIPEDPVSEGLYWAFQPTIVNPEDVVFTAEMNAYANDIKTINVSQNQINQQNFYLEIVKFTVYPTSFELTQLTDQLTQQTLLVCNTGTAPLTWELVEAENPITVMQSPELTLEPVLKEYTLHYLPDGSIDCGYYANYTGFEPAEVAKSCGSSQSMLQASVPTGPTDIGYALDIGFVSDNFVSFPLNNFTGQTVVGTNPTTFYGMDFDASGTVLYALDDSTDQLGTIDLTTGAFTGLVACPPGGGVANWTGLSIDPTTDEFYASTATALYTINPSTGVSTLVGSFGTNIMIDIAINADGEMYGHDIETDSIYSIDTVTGAATLIGPTGYGANFAQGMDFDNDDGTLYIFLYQGSGANVYGAVNLSTGAVTPLAVSAPQGEFEGAIPIAGTPVDIPWVSEDPLAGTLEGDYCTEVTVTFDSTGLAVGDYTGFLRINYPPAVPGEVSLILHVTDIRDLYLPLILK